MSNARRNKSKAKAKPKAVIPHRIRKIRGAMEEKALSLEDVAGLTGLKYFRVCKLLRYLDVDRDALNQIEDAVRKAPMPPEEAYV